MTSTWPASTWHGSWPVAEAVTAALAGFGDALREAGVAVGTGDVLSYVAALAVLNPADLADMYWAGRATLISRHEDEPAYDEVFRRYFLGEDGPPRPPPPARPRPAAAAALVVPADRPGEDPRPRPLPSAGWMASDAEVLRNRSFAACTPGELAALRRIMTRMRLAPPRRRVRRYRAASRLRAPRGGARPDMRRVARESMRGYGEPARLCFRERKIRPRRLVVILDVSGSMADYSRLLLQFAHAARRAVPARVEVFCFGTRLTRITRELNRRRPDDALDRAARAVCDWDGGTRIGACLEDFVRRYARAGLARGAVVVICSDGLDRGDPEVLASAMERLRRLCYRIIWLSPHASRDCVGLMAAGPHIDLLLSGHDLTALEALAVALPRA
jgi:uncharacterized protein with von Willebrand factor type A (vWA) domain